MKRQTEPSSSRSHWRPRIMILLSHGLDPHKLVRPRRHMSVVEYLILVGLSTLNSIISSVKHCIRSNPPSFKVLHSTLASPQCQALLSLTRSQPPKHHQTPNSPHTPRVILESGLLHGSLFLRTGTVHIVALPTSTSLTCTNARNVR